MAESNREEIAKLEALYANNPGGRVFTHLAEAYRKAGELDRARQILEDGITRHAEYASAHVVLGRVLQDQGAREEAAAAFRRVLELDPENRVALRSLGDLAREGDQREEALAYFRQLLSLDPTDDQIVRIIDQLNSAIHTDEAEPLPALEADVAEAIAPLSPDSGSSTEEPDFRESTPAVMSRTEELPSEQEFVEAHTGSEAEAPEPAEPFTVETFVGADPAEFHAATPAEESSPESELEEYVTPDIRLDWDSEGVPHGEAAALPGDLAAFAEAGPPDAEESLSEITPIEASSGTAEAHAAAADDADSSADAASDDASASDAAESTEGGAIEGIELQLPDEAEQQAEEAEQQAEAVEEAMAEIGEFIDLGEEPAPSDVEQTFEAMLSSVASGRARPAAEPSELPAELQTETLAELYLSQGFDDRAAEVYRSLLAKSPGDERLQRRLAEVEAKLAAAADADEESGEDADTLASFWTGGGEPASVEPTLYAWTETEEPDGPTIGAFFGELLSWRRGSGNGHAPARAEAESPAGESLSFEAPASPELTGTGEAAPAETGASAFEVVTPPAKQGGEPDTAFQEVATDEPGPGESAFEQVKAPRSTDAFVAQEPATPPASGMLSQFSAPLNEVEAAFEEWFSGAPSQPKPPAEPAHPAAPPATVQPQPAPEPASAEPKSAAPAPPAVAKPDAPGASSEESEDDEDLEMFRSWLQSLKR